MNNSLLHTIVLNQKFDEAKIVFVPTVKHIPQTSLVQNLKPDSKKIAQAPLNSHSKTTFKKVEKKAASQKSSAKAKPTKQTPQSSSTTTIKNDSKSPSKKVEKKPAPKKPEQSKEPKIEPKKIAEVPKDQPILAKNEAPQSPIVEEVQEVIYLGRDDKMLLDLHNQTQEQIEKVWHPPVGLSKDLLCSIKVKLDPKGSVVDLAVEESSQVISYDIAARTALDSVVFPKGLWGKEVIITFKQ